MPRTFAAILRSCQSSLEMRQPTRLESFFYPCVCGCMWIMSWNKGTTPQLVVHFLHSDIPNWFCVWVMGIYESLGSASLGAVSLGCMFFLLSELPRSRASCSNGLRWNLFFGCRPLRRCAFACSLLGRSPTNRCLGVVAGKDCEFSGVGCLKMVGLSSTISNGCNPSPSFLLLIHSA